MKRLRAIASALAALRVPAHAAVYASDWNDFRVVLAGSPEAAAGVG